MRKDGDMVVAENRAHWCTQVGANERDIVLMAAGRKGDEVAWVGRKSGGEMIQTDALLTKESGVVLGLLTADCLPVVFHEPVVGIVGLAHCGWSGVHLKLAATMVAEIVENGGSADGISVSIGPSIKKQSYIVPIENLLQRNDPAWQPFMYEDEQGRWHVDLAGYVRAQLEEAGVLPGNIVESKVDTYSDIRYFSHRRAVQTGEHDGRFLTLVWQS